MISLIFQNWVIIVLNIFKYGAGEEISNIMIIEIIAGTLPNFSKNKEGIDLIFNEWILGAKNNANSNAAM